MNNIEKLLLNLESTNANVRYEACEELRVAKAIPKQAIDALEKAAIDPDPEVADAARRALLIHTSPTPVSQPSLNSSNPQITSFQMPSSPPNSPEYIFALEKRIMYLEAEIASLRQGSDSTSNISALISSKLPNSNIISQSFVSRAFAVWGHYFVAQLMIAIPIYCIILLITLATDY